MKKSAKSKPKRPKMAHISEEMKEWANLLSQELEKWPKVSAKPMFGMRCYYRGSKVFGALPVTRSIESSNSLMFKMNPMPANLLVRADNDSRVSSTDSLKTRKWRLFEIANESDLRDALWWLNQAYEKAK